MDRGGNIVVEINTLSATAAKNKFLARVPWTRVPANPPQRINTEQLIHSNWSSRRRGKLVFVCLLDSHNL
jgi:hypothetical protein